MQRSPPRAFYLFRHKTFEQFPDRQIDVAAGDSQMCPRAGTGDGGQQQDGGDLHLSAFVWVSVTY